MSSLCLLSNDEPEVIKAHVNKISSGVISPMDEITGTIAYEIAEELGLIEKLKELRRRVKEERGNEIKGSFNGVLRALGSEMQRRHGEYGEEN